MFIKVLSHTSKASIEHKVKYTKIRKLEKQTKKYIIGKIK